MFVKELSQVTNLPFNEIAGSFKLNLLGGNIVYVSNFIKILSYSVDVVCLKVRGNVLNIEGEDLTISQISPKEIILKGKISSISLGNKK